ncbi:oxidoreductase [Mycobacterium asiaticum]|uniref:Oxidoreductase n=1 Tax=Mycobacterium asiaticum TaxID=1790 RepID=A0A1A3NX61_MYCAS|nr:flavin reductase family protein [Mycobacterium asiaticum]OBK24922.1 oxidoreductase [Mycobacterium asiaticum]
MSERSARIHHGGVIGEPFDDLMTMLDTPVYVVTTQAEGHPSGCLVAFATQTSVQPPSFMVGLPLNCSTHEVACQSEYVAVHVLPRSKQLLAEMFVKQAPGHEDTLSHCSWRAGPLGMPILDDAAAWFVGRTVSRSPVADHVAYLLEPVATWAPDSVEELLYLSDIDEEYDPGQEAPQRLYTGERSESARKYGMRFTLDVP